MKESKAFQGNRKIFTARVNEAVKQALRELEYNSTAKIHMHFNGPEDVTGWWDEMVLR